MAKEKPLLLRLSFIDKKIREGMQSGKLANSKSIAAEYEVSAKTILRDIDYLHNQRQAPITYDPQLHGYRYTEENYSLPAMDISASDLFSLYIAQKALKQHENTPIYQKLVSVFRRIEESLPPGRVSMRPSWVDARISVIQGGHTRIDAGIWEAVAQGLHENRTLRISYQKPGAAGARSRGVDPYHAVCYEGEWYMVGYCHKRQKVLTFAMSRIQEAHLGKASFSLPEDFDFEKISAKWFGIFSGGREYTVEILFAKECVPYVIERQWHKTQRINKNADGNVQLTMNVNHLYEIKRWILSWGSGVRVLGPPELVEAVKQDLQAALQGYG